jgi:hypothetical protein
MVVKEILAQGDILDALGPGTHIPPRDSIKQEETHGSVPNLGRTRGFGEPISGFVASDADANAWGLGGTYGVGRGLSSPLSAGTWQVTAVHDPDNSGFSGFNLKTSTQAGFDADEVFRFGLDGSGARGFMCPPMPGQATARSCSASG